MNGLAQAGITFRICIFVIGFLVALATPLVGWGFACVYAPAQYILVPDKMPTLDRTYQSLDGSGLEFSVSQVGSQAQAADAAESRYDKTEADKKGIVLGAAGANATLETTGKDPKYRKIVSLGNYVVDMHASDKKSLELGISRQDWIKDNPNKSIVLEALKIPAVLIGFVVAYGTMLFLMALQAFGWIAAVGPGKKETVAGDDLRTKILSLNQMDLPFEVVEHKSGRLITQWKVADPKWAPVIHDSSLPKLHQVVMELDPQGHKVRVVDEARSVSWKDGIGKHSFMPVLFHWVPFFQYDNRVKSGVRFTETGWNFDPTHQYSFSLGEMKNPLIEAITSSGWRFAPVVSFARVLGG